VKSLMPERLLWRRSATAAGTYGSVGLGVLATLVAARELGPHAFGLFSLVVVTASFFQILLDLTVEDVMIKFGYRYQTAGRWGRLRRLYSRGLALKAVGGLLAACVVAVLAPFADSIFGNDDLFTPMLLVALLPVVVIPEAIAGAVLVLVGRYDVRGGFLSLTQAFRLAGIAAGAQYGIDQAIVGLVLGQAAASLAVGGAGFAFFRRLPAVPSEPLGEDRPQILRFVVQSSVATSLVALRGTIVPLLLGVVTSPTQVGYFRVAQAPQTGLAALSSPVRLIMLTEQTRDWEAGSPDAVFSGIRRFTLTATLVMAVSVPPLYVFMPDLVRGFYGSAYSPASTAARLMLLTGAIQLVFAWSKSFPVSIGRAGLRILTHGIETLVVIPLVVVLGDHWGATGAATATLIATCVFAAVWVVALGRIRGSPPPVPFCSRSGSEREPMPL
jgi:O-antigen/teichoic acid export membrane protein